MKKSNNELYVIRCQERRIEKAVAEKIKNGFTKISEIIESETIPNSIYLYNCIKDELLKENQVICRYNEIKLLTITLPDLIEIVKKVFASRKNY